MKRGLSFESACDGEVNRYVAMEQFGISMLGKRDLSGMVSDVVQKYIGWSFFA